LHGSSVQVKLTMADESKANPSGPACIPAKRTHALTSKIVALPAEVTVTQPGVAFGEPIEWSKRTELDKIDFLQEVPNIYY